MKVEKILKEKGSQVYTIHVEAIIGDVVKVMLSHKDHEIKYLKDYIESKYPV